MAFQKWSPVGSQSTDLSSLVVKGVTSPGTSAKADFVDTIDRLLLYSNDVSNPLPGFLRKVTSDINIGDDSLNCACRKMELFIYRILCKNLKFNYFLKGFIRFSQLYLT